MQKLNARIKSKFLEIFEKLFFHQIQHKILYVPTQFRLKILRRFGVITKIIFLVKFDFEPSDWSKTNIWVWFEPKFYDNFNAGKILKIRLRIYKIMRFYEILEFQIQGNRPKNQINDQWH